MSGSKSEQWVNIKFPWKQKSMTETLVGQTWLARPDWPDLVACDFPKDQDQVGAQRNPLYVIRRYESKNDGDS